MGHVRDTLSVWKRSETCCMAFKDEEDDAYYKYIPPEEVLPVDAAAPCVAHLLHSDETDVRENKAKVDDSYDDDDLSLIIGVKGAKAGDSGKQECGLQEDSNTHISR